MNYLELLAILLAIKSLCATCSNCHIQVQCDNKTAVCYVNNMGGSKSKECNALTKQIWEHYISHNFWLSATHLPGCENTQADLESRQFNDRTERILDPSTWESGWLSGYLSGLPPLRAGVQFWPWPACGLSFSRSQPDSRVFLQVLRFSSLIKIDSQLIDI